MRIITKAAATLVGVAAITGALAGTALADPPSGVIPANTDIVGTGSDTTQLVVDQLSTDYNAQSPAPTRKLYSFDAVGSSTIQPKAGCSASTVRPNGSGGGINELKKNLRPTGDTTDYCVDFARSSRTTQAGDGTGLDFIRFAQDAVTWSATSIPAMGTTAAKPTHAPASLSNAELKAIYSCDGSTLPVHPHSGPVTWDQVGGTGSNQVVPVIPQSASGTRAFFLGAIYGSSPITLGSCVKGLDNSVEENEGTNAIFSGSNSQDLVFPYSVAVYLAQSVHNHGAGDQGNQVLGSAENPSTGAVIAPTVTSGGTPVINPQLAVASLTRFVYNVVRDNGTSTHVPDYLQTIFGAGNDTGYVCTNPTAQADITSYGFRSLGSGCGVITPSVA